MVEILPRSFINVNKYFSTKRENYGIIGGMKRLERSKLFVVDYSIDNRWPTFIIADSIEDALSDHKGIFPSYHRNLKLIQFLSANPMITEKISQRDLIPAIQPELSAEEEESSA